MVLDAVRGPPTTSQSRTEYFRSRTRAHTPKRGEKSDSSFDSESESEFSGRSLSEGALEGTTSCEESDGATEMALISASFQKSSTVGPSASANNTQPVAASFDEVGS